MRLYGSRLSEVTSTGTIGTYINPSTITAISRQPSHKLLFTTPFRRLDNSNSYQPTAARTQAQTLSTARGQTSTHASILTAPNPSDSTRTLYYTKDHSKNRPPYHLPRQRRVSRPASRVLDQKPCQGGSAGVVLRLAPRLTAHSRGATDVMLGLDKQRVGP